MTTSDWRMLRLGNVAKTYVPQRDKPEDLSGPIPWLRIEDFNGKYLSGSKSGQGVSAETVAAMNLRVFPAGTVVTSCSCVMGATAIAANPLVTNQTFIGIDPDPSALDQSFLYYWLIAHQVELQARASGSIQQYLSRDEFRRLRISAPALRSQRAIADYLDRETAQIDAFIAKNEELITLLTERRRATIGRAVTRGIRSDAPTRPSGVAWLGEVPSHWSVAGLARYAGTVSGVGFPESEQGIEDAEIAFYKVNSLGQADVDGVIRKSWDTISRETAQSLRAKILPAGTILLAKIGAALLLGRVRRTDRPACIDNNMMAIVPNEHLNARFASYALQTFDFETLANPGTVPSMDMYALMHRETAVPPLVEQEEIADHLDRRLAGIDAALATCRRGIHLAGERRAALISAAVTGKIDVGVTA